MSNGSDEQTLKRWTAKRRAALVIDSLRGTTTVVEAARAHGLTVAEIEQWKERFLTGAENALRSKPLDDEALKEQEIKRLKQKVGELVMDLDIGHPLGEGGHETKPFVASDVRRVAAALPAASLRHICRILNVSRSALYQPGPTAASPVGLHNQTQDDELITRIHELIQQHPTYGYRRIWRWCALATSS
jgi:transposase-like protein